jgi:hypothetical protein
MGSKNANATRSGRTIESLDDRGKGTANPGNKDRDGRKMPHYKDDVVEDQANAALKHVQTSGIADVDQDGTVSVDESKTIPKARP